MAGLNAEQLAYVFTHAELLVMLSLQRLEAMLDAGEAAPAPSGQELADAEAATMAELARQQQQWLGQTADEAPVGEAGFAAPAATLTAAAVDLGPEIEAALARAYAAIPARAQALQGVDAARLAPALAAVTQTLPALTGAMDAAGLSGWLDRLDAGDEALDRVVTEACALAGSAG